MLGLVQILNFNVMKCHLKWAANYVHNPSHKYSEFSYKTGKIFIRTTCINLFIFFLVFKPDLNMKEE